MRVHKILYPFSFTLGMLFALMIVSLQYTTKKYERIATNVKQSVANDSRKAKHLISQVSSAQEEAFHQLQNDVSSLMAYLNSRLRTDIRDATLDRIKAIQADLFEFDRLLGNQDAKQKVEYELRKYVERWIFSNQHPENCSTRKKLVCTWYQTICGFACRAHELANCLIMALASGRTLIIEAEGNRSFTHEYLMPASANCTDYTEDPVPWDPDAMQHAPVVRLPISHYIRPEPDYMPLAVPSSLMPALQGVHGFPFIWWLGQIVKYLFRPCEKFSKILNDAQRKFGFRHPIVGVHVRRTDKIETDTKEAEFFNIEEYMRHVDDYFDVVEMTETVNKRRIYLATDDVGLIHEVQTKYPHYEVITNYNATLAAAQVDSRDTQDSGKGILLDLHFLSASDYLVCTFSSTMCRLAYALMQQYHVDASAKFYSLDDIYWIYAAKEMFNQNHTAVLAHKAVNLYELDLAVGDKVLVNHEAYQDGYYIGRNYKTGKQGVFPSFKVKRDLHVFNSSFVSPDFGQ